MTVTNVQRQVQVSPDIFSKRKKRKHNSSGFFLKNQNCCCCSFMLYKKQSIIRLMEAFKTGSGSIFWHFSKLYNCICALKTRFQKTIGHKQKKSFLLLLTSILSFSLFLVFFCINQINKVFSLILNFLSIFFLTLHYFVTLYYFFFCL